jgi:hypothetical protein
MQESVASPLGAWESYYVIVGSSAAALTGLQFVVMALVAESREDATSGTIDAFGTPTVVHFCAALLVSAVLSAPWPTLSSVALLLGAAGVVGVGYTAIVNRRAHQQKGYQPVLEDWVWHVVLPLVAYATLLAAALTLGRHAAVALFMVGATALLLLFIGIHNSWDTVTYVALSRLRAREEQEGPEAPR